MVSGYMNEYKYIFLIYSYLQLKLDVCKFNSKLIAVYAD